MNRTLLARIGLIVGLGLSLTVSAQTASTAEPKGDVVELSPFEVSAASNRGYVASETMTGSRVATQIKDLPYSVNVLTSEFFDDFAFFEINENVAYIGSFTGLDQGGGFNLRGFNATNQLRDGFFRLGRYGSSNVDRIEVIKGPNAAIYGQTSPGGMVNMISKKPKKKESYKASGSFGSYDTNRETVEATGPVGKLPGTYYILTGGFYERGFETEMSRLRNSEAYLAVQHEFKNKSSLLLQAEYFLREVHSVATPAPYVVDGKGTTATTDDQIVGIAKELGNIQMYGPNSELNRGMVSFTGTYDRQFNSVFSARVSSNYFRARRWEFNQNTFSSAATVNPANPVIARGASPNKGLIFEDGGGIQGDVLARYLMAGHVEGRTLLTFDFNDYYRYDPQWTLGGPALALWTPYRSVTFTPDLKGLAAPVYYYPQGFDWSNSVAGRKNKNRTRDIGTLVRQQFAFWQGRALVFGGVRYDHVNYNLRDLAGGRQSNFTITATEPNVGANVALTSSKNLRAYVNYSQSFFPNQQFITAALISPQYKSEEAQGLDYGLKGSALDDRLNYTIGAYRIERQNVVVSEIDPVTGLTVSLPEGNQLVQGFELDANWRVSDDVYLGGSYGYVDSQITSFGFQTQSIGRSAARISPQNGGAYVRYSPGHGWLRGFSGNLGVTYQARTPTDAPAAGDTYTNGVFVRSTNQWAQTVPALTLISLGARYTVSSSSRWHLKHTFGFNVNNVTDKDYLTPNRQVGDRRSVFFTYTLQH